MIPLQLAERARRTSPPAGDMTSTNPRPLQPPLEPPSSALPPLPTSKGRKSLPAQLAVATSRLPTNPQTPSKLRTPSRAGLPVPASAPVIPTPQTPHSASASSVPTLKSTAGSKIATPGSTTVASTGEHAVRRTVSIASFPQPPKSAGSRIAAPSGRPSLGGTITTSFDKKALPQEPTSGGSGTPNSAGGATAAAGTGVRPKRLKKTPSSAALHGAYANTPSLLNGSGDTVPLSAGGNSAGGASRGSGSLLGLPSPPRSRSSSAEGSYSTTATTFEDIEEVQGGSTSRGRDETREGSERRGRSSGKEAKGNVIVSVRVRPDEGGDLKSEGEWMVDGRRSLVAFRGKEGGDYYYGENSFEASSAI